jgi:hypothetical protein
MFSMNMSAGFIDRNNSKYPDAKTNLRRLGSIEMSQDK